MQGMPKKNPVDCIKNDTKSFSLSYEDAQDRDDWRVRIKGARATS